MRITDYKNKYWLTCTYTSSMYVDTFNFEYLYILQIILLQVIMIVIMITHHVIVIVIDYIHFLL